MRMGASRSSFDKRFRFDRELWEDFRIIAQPYFYPPNEGACSWGLLVLALLVGTVSGTYWVVTIGQWIYLSFAPENMIPRELTGRVDQIGAMPWPLLMASFTGFAAVVSSRHKRQLEGRWLRWAMLGLLLLLLFCVTGLNVYLSYVFRGIDNMLVERDSDGFYQAMWGYGMALVVAVPVIALYKYVRKILALRWRGFLTELFLERYLANRSYYKLDSNSEGTDIDNPDQRISEDVHYFANETLQFLLDVLGGVLDLFSFAAILWSTSRALMGSLLAYAAVGTVVAIAIGKRLVELNYHQLRKEADLRYSLVHIRDNAECIAFYGGESREGLAVKGRLRLVIENNERLIHWEVYVGAFQNTFFYLARLVPYLVIAKLYFDKKVDFGTVGQGAFAFSMVLSSVTLIVERIASISRFSAGIRRLSAFYKTIGDGRADAQSIPMVGKVETELADFFPDDQKFLHGIRTVLGTGSHIELKNLTLETPTGRTLVEKVNLQMGGAGDRMSANRLLIVGPSGYGKSSLLRAIAGLWCRGRGEVHRPPAGEMLFLPQKPYMPLGDLRTQLLYPNELASVSDDVLISSLKALGLGDLPSRFPGGFDEVQDWARVLSIGEQQRLAAARCLVSSPPPAIVVLDEATSALPIKDEMNLYQLLRNRCISYISVGHRESLLQHHDIVLEICGERSWKLLQAHDFKLSAVPDISVATLSSSQRSASQ